MRGFRADLESNHWWIEDDDDDDDNIEPDTACPIHCSNYYVFVRSWFLLLDVCARRKTNLVMIICGLSTGMHSTNKSKAHAPTCNTKQLLPKICHPNHTDIVI